LGAVLGLVTVGAVGALGAVYAIGWLGQRGEVEPEPKDVAVEEPPHVSPGAALRPLAGQWWGEGGVAYEAVIVGATLELRIVNPDQLPGTDYLPNEAVYVLRPIEGDPNDFHVEARIRPLAPRGTTYDRPRSGASCVLAVGKASGKPLLAAHAIDRLVVQTVKLDVPATSFVREGTRVVGCTGLGEAHGVATELVLGRTAISSPTPPHGPLPPHDTGLHDGAAHDAGPHELPAHDAGAHDAGPHTGPSLEPGVHDGGGGKVGAACEADAHCVSGNCYNRRCMPAGKGYGAPCALDWQCGTHHCVSGSCR
jgi:hypothetical protein